MGSQKETLKKIKTRCRVTPSPKKIERDVVTFLQEEAVRQPTVFSGENALLTQKLEGVTNADILSELERLSVLSASKTNMKMFVKNVVDMIYSFLKCSVVCVTLYETDAGKISYRYIVDKDGEFVDADVVKLEERYAQKAVETKRFHCVHTPRKIAGMRTVAHVPLLLREHLLGTISVLFPERVDLDGALVSALHVCASNLALMVQNVRLYSSVVGNHSNIIKALIVSLEARDRYTHGHSQRVTDYAIRVARKMKCAKRDLRILQEVAPLHDIGKIAISDTTLNKVGRLTDEEFNEIKSHALKGSIMLETLGFDRESVQLVRWHHEAFSGRGYPDRLEGEEIPLLARILCVADAYDAMTSDRPYRKRMSVDDARAEIKRCSGSQFCPKASKAFLSLRF